MKKLNRLEICLKNSALSCDTGKAKVEKNCVVYKSSYLDFSVENNGNISLHVQGLFFDDVEGDIGNNHLVSRSVTLKGVDAVSLQAYLIYIAQQNAIGHKLSYAEGLESLATSALENLRIEDSMLEIAIKALIEYNSNINNIVVRAEIFSPNNNFKKRRASEKYVQKTLAEMRAMLA